MSGRAWAERVVDLAASTLPAAIRAERREAWRADLRDAESLGLGRSGIAVGAVRAALATPRDARAWGIAPGRLAVRRGRWAIALFVVAVILVVAGWLAPPLPGAIVGTGLLLGAAFLGAVGLVLAGAALHALLAGQPAGARWTIVLLAPIAAIPVLAVVLLLGGMPAVVAGTLLGGLGIAAATWWWPRDPDPRRRRSRPGIPERFGARASAFAGAVAISGALAVVVLNIFVWEPMAKVPGLRLDELYARMSAAGESPTSSVPFVVVWVVSWLPLVVGLLLVAVVGPRGRLARLDARRLARAALVAVAAIGFGQWFAGFGMGMSVADAFGTTGGGAGWVTAAISATSLLCGIAAALRVLPPPDLPDPPSASIDPVAAAPA
ncbi:hypothetical protein [Agromyces seonyuensis]|uniref:Uncharacterized protein n=1 Tax=Agromyces seonyuensis TaxID=2662446 RepID=A0A6I4NV63_9MICO|nr:hypothetical protein [Agromyces seonyuensis]MWB98346.1 hypothetical protein [Agromyces seonyuensis]